MKHNLVDLYALLIHPLVLGSGRRLFRMGAFSALRLVDAKPTTTVWWSRPTSLQNRQWGRLLPRSMSIPASDREMAIMQRHV
jgi:dihydrofolate reductase